MKSKFVLFLVVMLFPTIAVARSTFTLYSPDLGGQLTSEQVFDGFGCSGQNKSPALRWENPPSGTKSFAVTVYDPDAPTGSGWWHWIIFDIPKDVSALKGGSDDSTGGGVPEGAVQSRTSFGTVGYGGACPPQGDAAHRYVFTVYALRVEKLGLAADVTPAMAGYYLNQNSLSKASLISYYAR